MNLTELSALLGQAADVLRVETLNAYRSDSDTDMLERYLRGDPKPDPAEKQPWLDRLTAAADAGRPWRRLRVVSRPVPDYVRYACEFGYVDNVAAGEDVRVIDEATSPIDVGHPGFATDLYLADGRVIVMDYEVGRFSSAYEPGGSLADALADHCRRAWGVAEPFTDWWADNPHLHRNLAAT